MDSLKVIEAYQNCKSLKRIAAELNLSEVKVRRILIMEDPHRRRHLPCHSGESASQSSYVLPPHFPAERTSPPAAGTLFSH